MDELSPLFQDIEFHERYRGYDPDEVDAFVDRVARAAALMRGRISELHERAEAAEARGGAASPHSNAEETLTRTLVLAQRTADAAVAEAREEADRLTADAATSAQAILSAAEAEAQLTLRESQAEATAILRDAEDRAGLVLAEAETDRRAMVTEAEVLASEVATAEKERVAAEVSELHDYRAFLSDDIEILERHLTEERLQLTASVSALTDLLESPEAFRVSRPPATSGVEIDDETIESIAEADPVADLEALAEPEPTDESVFAAPVVEEVVPGEPESDEVMSDEAAIEQRELGEPESEEAAPAASVFDVPVVAVAEEREFDETEAEEPMFLEGTIDLVAAEVDESLAAEIDLAGPDPEIGPVPDSDPETFDPGPSSGGEPAFAGMVERPPTDASPAEPAASRLVTAADLDSSAAPAGRLGFETSTFDRLYEDVGPVTEAVPALQDGSLFAEPETADDPFLDQLREAMEGEPIPREDDDALSAFFDQDDDDSGRSWFGRRR
jgi:DivIVA domain-containing protein